MGFGAERTAAEEPDRPGGERIRIAPHELGGWPHPVEVIGCASNDGGVVCSRISGLADGFELNLQALLAERSGDTLRDTFCGSVTACVGNENSHNHQLPQMKVDGEPRPLSFLLHRPGCSIAELARRYLPLLSRSQGLRFLVCVAFAEFSRTIQKPCKCRSPTPR